MRNFEVRMQITCKNILLIPGNHMEKLDAGRIHYTCDSHAKIYIFTCKYKFSCSIPVFACENRDFSHVGRMRKIFCM